MNLVDTDVLVDCLRGTVPAQEWLKRLAQQSFAVPAVAAMELVMGCRDRADLERIQRFLATIGCRLPCDFCHRQRAGAVVKWMARWSHA